MFSFEEFVAQAKCGLERELRNRYDKVNLRIVTNRKVNCEMVGLECDVSSGCAYGSTLYMESLYNAYLEHGDMNEIVSTATEVIEASIKECRYLQDKVDFRHSEDGVIFQLIHTEQNKELLKTMPHRELMDLSIVYRCILDISDDGMLSAPVTHAYADMLGLNEEELYELAFENTRYIMQPTVHSMEQVIEGLEEALDMKGEIRGELTMEQRPPLYVITNSKRTWGAASILYKGKLLSLAEQIDSDLYLIPSSMHEMMITPAKQEMLEVVESTLYEANQNAVDIGERLSNEIYLYDRKSNSITQVTDSPHKMLDDGPTESMGMGMC